jgi:hypothetical protein
MTLEICHSLVGGEFSLFSFYFLHLNIFAASTLLLRESSQSCIDFSSQLPAYLASLEFSINVVSLSVVCRFPNAVYIHELALVLMGVVLSSTVSLTKCFVKNRELQCWLRPD